MPEGSLLVTPSRNPFYSDLLGAVFEVCKDPNMIEEEYLAGVTGMSLDQVHSLCKQGPESFLLNL